MRIDTEQYKIEIVVQGYPGKAVCHGGLGWCTVALLRGKNRVVLIDTGTFGMRQLLIDRLQNAGFNPADVTDLLLTHCHYDHTVNWPLFKDARIVISGVEIPWGLQQPWGRTPVPELYVEKLSTWPTLNMVEDGDEVLPGITARLAPGHTPGSIVYILTGSRHDVIFTGDAVKNRAELISRTVGPCHDRAASHISIDEIWQLWNARSGSILVPGHDLPMTQQDGEIVYLGTRDAAISAWFDDDLEQKTIIRLHE